MKNVNRNWVFRVKTQKGYERVLKMLEELGEDITEGNHIVGDGWTKVGFHKSIKRWKYNK